MIKNLLPTVWRRSESPVRREDEHPFFALQREMNQMFDDFFRGNEPSVFGGTRGFGSFIPPVDVRENGKEIRVKVELPGLDEKDVEVTLTDGALTIRGEKKEEKESQGKDFWQKEISSGSFHRVIPLPEGLDSEKVDARFRNGILTVTLPLPEEAKSKGKRISVKSG